MTMPTRSTALNALALTAALVLGACTVVEEGPGADAETDVAVGVKSDAAADLEFRKVLRDTDVQIGRWVGASLEAGAEAREDRELADGYVRAVVKRRLDEFVATSGNVANRTFRLIAVKALGFSDDPRAIAALGAALGDEDPVVLTNATFAASVSGSTELDPALLLPHLSHADADVRSNALVALRKIFEGRTRQGRAPIGEIDRELALGLLEASLIDPVDPMVRGNAAGALGSLRDRRSVDALVDRLSDDDPFIRTHTALALGKIGDPKAIPALVEVIDETPRATPRQAVLTALTVLLEQTGRSVPATLGDTERNWRIFVRESGVETAPRR